ncbi:MAG TPA: hypothetical protein VN648_31530, partial [Candidatus Methylomirabilis sp.]|nr:hypothetical protein [Candidatus Methylomirabilis sp.]
LRAAPTLRTTPVILLTVLDNPSIATTGREAGATVTLRKPADPETIVTTVEQVLGRKESPDKA